MRKAFRTNPGKFFYENLMIGAQMMDLGRQAGVEKFVLRGRLDRREQSS